MRGFCPLASGSTGNCIFVGTEKTRILIDAGISAKSTAHRLLEIGVDIRDIDALLISHEHTDHIRGISTLASKYRIPVFANSETAKAILHTLEQPPKFKIFSTGEPFEFGDIEIHPFTIPHDTLDPVAFIITAESRRLGLCTDLGFATTLVVHHLKHCDYLYLEANHQPSMVYACNRPPVYKQRVLSRQGHLSNDQCADLLMQVAHDNLQHVHLAHLSKECNHPELALEIVRAKLQNTPFTPTLSIAYPHTISRPIRFDSPVSLYPVPLESGR